MELIKIDALGDVCPVPLVKAKNALKKINENGAIVVSVDSDICKENLEKMAKEMGMIHSSKKINDNIIEVEIIKGKYIPKDVVVKNENIDKKNKIIVISSNKMGEGNEELGKTLMKAFIYSVSEMENLPKAIIFYNSGVFLVAENSPILEDLQKISNNGVSILSCGACLNYYELTEKLTVGEVTNMYAILDMMDKADKIIKP